VPFSERLAQVRQQISEKDLDALLISQTENRRYLSGFTGSEGYLLISLQRALLAADFRYTEQARSEAPDFEVLQIKGKITEWLLGLISELGSARLAFEANDMPFATHQQLVKALRQEDNEIELLPTEALIEAQRATKEEEELIQLSKAAEIADRAFEHITGAIRPGMTEGEVAWQIERALRESGSEDLPFSVIVQSGPNAALPHLRPTDRVIEVGEPIVMDFGARVGGYCSDMTRTLCLGSTSEEFVKRYDLVLGAQLTALATLSPDMTGEEVDQLARTAIDQGGFGEAFGHGLGHGIGLVAHESPRLGQKSTDRLSENMVFTVEPGIYISGWGGIRIEDTVVLQHGRARPLTKAPK
jgi:Xaa-Pro aminopeptidase